jgi:hypothetical protein
VNRQQFNKYLSGTHRPSPYNLSRICRYFDVEEFEILLPPEQFKSVLAHYQDRRRRAAPDRIETLIEDAFRTNIATLQRYEGYYHGHFTSFGLKDRVVRSLICLYLQDGRMYVKTIERFFGHPLGQGYTMKYVGLVTAMAGRLFIMESQTFGEGKLSLTILNTTYRSRMSLLSGLTMSTSTERDRVPAASRAVYKYLGKTIDKRQALSVCGDFSPDSNAIEENIVRLVSNDIPPEEKVLFGRLI